MGSEQTNSFPPARVIFMDNSVLWRAKFWPTNAPFTR